MQSLEAARPQANLVKCASVQKEFVGVALLRGAAEVCLISDGLPSTDKIGAAKSSWLQWRPVLTSTGGVTLADAFDNTGRANSEGSIDAKRHKNKMNVAFVDGHVETVNMASGDLAKIYLIPQ